MDFEPHFFKESSNNIYLLYLMGGGSIYLQILNRPKDISLLS